MEINLSNRVTRYVVTLIFVLLAVSCVREEYEISEDALNLEVTVFQEGVQIPLGSTDSLKIKTLLESLGGDESAEYLEYIKTLGPDGVYALGMSGSEDLSESLSVLNDLQDQIKIEGLQISEEIPFNLSSVDLSDFKVSGQDYKMEYDLGQVVGNLDLNVPQLDPFKMEVKTSLGEYVPDLSGFDFGFDENVFPPVHTELTELAGSIPTGLVQLLGESVYKADIPLDPSAGFSYVHPVTGATLVSLSPMAIEMKSDPHKISMSMNLPEGVKSIDSIVLKEGAAITITITAKNTLFTGGYIVPHLDLDVHETFGLEEAGSNGHIVDDFNIDAKGAVVKKSYGVRSIAVSKSDVVDGKLVINREISIDKASLGYENLTTSLEKLAEAVDPMDFDLSVSFDNFEVDYVDLTVDHDDQISVEENSSIPMQLSFDVPEDVIQSIGSVKLAKTMPAGASEGNIHLSLSASNLPDYTHLNLETLEIVFPEELVVEGAPDGRLSYKVADLAGGLDEYVFIKEIRLPKPVNGKISVNKEITVKAKANASVSGSVNSAELAGAEDVAIDIEVKSDLQFDDFKVAVKGFNYDVEENYLIEAKLPDALKDLKGDITVYPSDNPALDIRIVKPQINVPVVAGKGGLVIKFPTMLKFNADDLAALGSMYDGVGTLNIPEGHEVPEEISLHVDRIVVSPETRDDGIYVSSEFDVKGSLGIAEGTVVDKSAIDVLTGSDVEAKKFKLSVSVPDLVPSDLAIDSYTAEFSQEFKFELLSGDVVPDMISGIGEVELDNVYINLGVDASELMSKLGNDADLIFNLEVSIPDYIILENVAGQKDPDNKAIIINLNEKADAKGQINVDPIKVKAIDLTGVVESGEGLAGTIAFAGTVTLADASINVDELNDSDDVKISLTGGIKGSGENGEITLSKVTAKVDYQLDPVKIVVDLSSLREALNTENLSVTLALSHVHLGLDIATNLGISALANLEIVPYYAGVAKDAIKLNDLAIDAPSTAGEVKHTKYWLGGNSECAPDGYTFKQVPILELLKDIPDSLHIQISAGTDKTKDCVLDTQTEYVLIADYSLEVPLQFDEKSFNISFTHTITGIPEVIGLIFQYGSLALTGEAVSGLPLNLNMTAELLDPAGNVIPVDDKVGKLVINACEAIDKPSVTELNLLFGAKGGANALDISAIRLRFNASAVSVPLTEDSFLKLKLQALVPEGVTLDLNDLMSNDETAGE
jgi:hypothetical protein